MAIISFSQGLLLDFRYPALGCVLASFVLAYLAWIRPKKDIVALSTPIYSLIFFVVPTEYMSGIILQLLYAVSLTILLVRLKYRFGKTGTVSTLTQKNWQDRSGRMLNRPVIHFRVSVRKQHTMQPWHLSGLPRGNLGRQQRDPPSVPDNLRMQWMSRAWPVRS